jgi:antitoxin component YwqK of YwqJK toxin-antitoxin module
MISLKSRCTISQAQKLKETLEASGIKVTTKESAKSFDEPGSQLFDVLVSEDQLEQARNVLEEAETGIINDGEAVTYYPTGEIFTKTFYKDNLLSGEYLEYFQNGKLAEKGTYTDDVRDGVFEYYYESGQLEKKVEYRKGKLIGPYAEYYENGTLCISAVFDDGFPQGEVKLFDETGKLLLIKHYSNGLFSGSDIQPGVTNDVTLELEGDGFWFDIQPQGSAAAVKKESKIFEIVLTILGVIAFFIYEVMKKK